MSIEGRPDWFDTAPCLGLTAMFFPRITRESSLGRGHKRANLMAIIRPKAVCSVCQHNAPCLARAWNDGDPLYSDGIAAGVDWGSAAERVAVAKRMDDPMRRAG